MARDYNEFFLDLAKLATEESPEVRNEVVQELQENYQQALAELNEVEEKKTELENEVENQKKTNESLQKANMSLYLKINQQEEKEQLAEKEEVIDDEEILKNISNDY